MWLSMTEDKYIKCHLPATLSFLYRDAEMILLMVDYISACRLSWFKYWSVTLKAVFQDQLVKKCLKLPSDCSCSHRWSLTKQGQCTKHVLQQSQLKTSLGGGHLPAAVMHPSPVQKHLLEAKSGQIVRPDQSCSSFSTLQANVWIGCRLIQGWCHWYLIPSCKKIKRMERWKMESSDELMAWSQLSTLNYKAAQTGLWGEPSINSCYHGCL